MLMPDMTLWELGTATHGLQLVLAIRAEDGLLVALTDPGACLRLSIVIRVVKRYNVLALMQAISLLFGLVTW